MNRKQLEYLLAMLENEMEDAEIGADNQHRAFLNELYSEVYTEYYVKFEKNTVKVSGTMVEG